LLEWFVVFSAWLTAGGWLLSAVHRLNTIGYLVWLAMFGLVAFAAVRGGLLWTRPAVRMRQFRWPRRWAPRLFACLLFLTLGGGLSHEISHFDALSYRIPRILQYLGENRWHWINTPEFRMNTVAAGIEWLWTPIFALRGSERLVNVLGSFYYLLLPGLLYSVWIRSGVSRRTAWWWAWIVPAGYCYAMQAGGPAVDLPGTIYTLAGIDFALRAWYGRSWRHLCLSVIAVSLMGTMRLMCLPLGLVWVGPVVLSLLRQRPPILASLGTAALGLACSFLPGGYFNIKYAGSFRGIPLDAYPPIKHPMIAILANFAWYIIQNLVPPVFPWSAQWNRLVERINTSLGDSLSGLPYWGTVERGASEQNAGLGCTIFLLALISVAYAYRHRPKGGAQHSRLDLWLWITPWMALVVFAAQLGLAQSARYLASYYPLLLTPVLASAGFVNLVKRAWWQRAALAVIAVSVVLVLLSRQRPLWPIYPLLKTAALRLPGNQALQKVVLSYDRLRGRRQVREFLESRIPSGETAVGYYAIAGCSDLELVGSSYERRLWRIDATESSAWLRSRHVRYVLFEEWNPKAPEHPTSSREWVQRVGGGTELGRFTSSYSMSDHAETVLYDLGPMP
jgi:hypothetical protein